MAQGPGVDHRHVTSYCQVEQTEYHLSSLPNLICYVRVMTLRHPWGHWQLSEPGPSSNEPTVTRTVFLKESDFKAMVP